MKFNLILVSLVVLVSYLTCKNMHKTEAPAAQPETASNDYGNSGYNWKASHVINGNNPDTAMTYQVAKAPARVNVPWDKIKPPSTSRRAFLATGWWNTKMAFQASDTTAHIHYMGKSLKFREDQTFDILKGEKVLETGHWAFDEDNKVMYISCNDTYFNNTWKIHENGFRMVWLGNTDLNFTGIQVRFDGSKTPPGGQ